MYLKQIFRILLFSAAAMSATKMSAQHRELPMPEIPASMPRAERPAFVVGHFWDAMDFNDTSALRSREFMEPNVVNFFYLLPFAPVEVGKEALENLITRITDDTQALQLFQELAEQYLSSPESPYYNEDNYIAVMRKLVGYAEFRDRAEFQLEMLSKNRPGTIAADFKFVTREGSETSLAATVDKPTLLLLYDPQCDHCFEVIDRLRTDTTVAQMIADGRLDVVAVCVEGDRDEWVDAAAKLPATWVSGFDVSDIIGRDIYFIQSIPSMYLLGADRTVARKNITDLSVIRDVVGLKE